MLWGGSRFDDHFASAGSLFMRKVGPVCMSKNRDYLTGEIKTYTVIPGDTLHEVAGEFNYPI